MFVWCIFFEKQRHTHIRIRINCIRHDRVKKEKSLCWRDKTEEHETCEEWQDYIYT